MVEQALDRAMVARRVGDDQVAVELLNLSTLTTRVVPPLLGIHDVLDDLDDLIDDGDDAHHRLQRARAKVRSDEEERASDLLVREEHAGLRLGGEAEGL